MIFVITQAGIASAIAAGTGGPKIDITTFKIGAAVAYTSSISDTALRGDELYTSTVSNYHIEGQNVVSYSLRMDESVGDFSYGEAGLYLSDGTLFALGCLDIVQPKTKSSGLSPGNSIEILAKLAFTNLPGLIDFSILDIVEAKVIEIASIDLIEAPIYSVTNMYLCHSGDDEGNPILVERSSDYKWRYSTHKHIALSGEVDASGANDTYQISSASIGTFISPVFAGKYIIQFLTGPWKGLARHISASTTNNVSWAAPLGGSPNLGDTFDIYVSDVSLMAGSGGASLEDDMIALILAFSSSNTE